WFWYLGMLVPVIGVVQVGGQAMADRYTYLPEIGVSIAAVWAVDALGRLRPLRGACAVAAAVVLAIFMGLAWRQTAYWHDSVALWTRDVACTEPTALGHLNLGRALKQQGRLEEAVDEYRRGLDLKPDAAEGHNNLGVALAMLGRMDEAVAEFRIAVALNPGLADAQRNLKKASR
ncbi:MAG: tetratricopeptide repeat protein, partial [Tepidisphaeraceae bacterium]